MKAAISKYLQGLGFHKSIQPLFIHYTHVGQDGKRECITLPKGKLTGEHIFKIKKHLDDNGWLCNRDFEERFMNTTKKRHTRQRSVESIALMTLKKGQVFYSTKQDKDITAISGYYDKKVKTERVFMLNPNDGKTEKLVRVTIL